MTWEFLAASTEYLYVNSAAVSAYPCTLTCIFNPNDITTGSTLVWVGDKDVSNDGFGISHSGDIGNDPIRAYSYHDSFVTSTVDGFVADTWQFAAGRFLSNASRQAFLATLGSDVSAGTAETTDLTPGTWDRTAIGCLARSAPTGYEEGGIARVAIYNVGLYTIELNALAHGWSPRLVRPSALVGLWDFRQPVGAAIDNASKKR